MVKVSETDECKVQKRPVSYLLLEDGTLFQGYSFGANRDSDGEIGKFLFVFTFFPFQLQ